jgi:hypothetical protein
MPSRHRLFIAVGILGIVVGMGAVILQLGAGTTSLASCSDLSTGPVSYQMLQCHPEAHLFYPGSIVVERLGSSQASVPLGGGTNPAFSGAVLASGASTATIYAWYDHWLKTHGWYRHPLLGAGYVSSHGYARGTREYFDVEIDAAAKAAPSVRRRIPAGGTLFEVRFVIAPYTPGLTPPPSCPPTPNFYCDP